MKPNSRQPPLLSYAAPTIARTNRLGARRAIAITALGVLGAGVILLGVLFAIWILSFRPPV